MSRYCRYVMTVNGLRFRDGELTVKLPRRDFLPGGLTRLVPGQLVPLKVITTRGHITDTRRKKYREVTVTELEEYLGKNAVITATFTLPKTGPDGKETELVVPLKSGYTQGRKARNLGKEPTVGKDPTIPISQTLRTLLEVEKQQGTSNAVELARHQLKTVPRTNGDPTYTRQLLEAAAATMCLRTRRSLVGDVAAVFSGETETSGKYILEAATTLPAIHANTFLHAIYRNDPRMLEYVPLDTLVLLTTSPALQPTVEKIAQDIYERWANDLPAQKAVPSFVDHGGHLVEILDTPYEDPSVQKELTKSFNPIKEALDCGDDTVTEKILQALAVHPFLHDVDPLYGGSGRPPTDRLKKQVRYITAEFLAKHKNGPVTDLQVADFQKRVFVSWQKTNKVQLPTVVKNEDGRNVHTATTPWESVSRRDREVFKQRASLVLAIELLQGCVTKNANIKTPRASWEIQKSMAESKNPGYISSLAATQIAKDLYIANTHIAADSASADQNQKTASP